MLSCYQLTLPLRPCSSFFRHPYVGLRGSFSSILTWMPLKFKGGGSLPSREGVHGFWLLLFPHSAAQSSPPRACCGQPQWQRGGACCLLSSGIWGVGAASLASFFSSIFTIWYSCLDSKQVSKLTVGSPGTQLFAFLQGPPCPQEQWGEKLVLYWDFVCRPQFESGAQHTLFHVSF